MTQTDDSRSLLQEVPGNATPADRVRYRAGQGFELILFDRLPLEEQAPLADLLDDPDLYGVLKPRPGAPGTVKVVNRDLALLWLTLAEPGPLPFYVGRDDAAGAERAITDLVLDGVLEVEVEGSFLAGADAAPRLLAAASEAAGGHLCELSRAALRYGEALALDDPDELGVRLYSYHRLPVTARWAERISGPEATLEWLGAGAGTRLHRELDRQWRRAGAEEVKGWIAWSPRSPEPQRARASSYKLYVSPAPESLPAAFAAVVETLSALGLRPFKVGADAAGVLRPDKLVVYFAGIEELHTLASALAAKLADLPVHGVPFTAEIGRSGLLSWGMDPPRAARLFSWQEQESWRLWVARRLAAALTAARASGGKGLAPWQFALERLRRAGVDVERWTPSTSLWLEKGDAEWTAPKP